MTHLKEGQTAPEFSGTNEKGELISSKDLKDSKYVLFFYPRDDSPGCTKQACSVRDYYKELRKMGIKIYGVSPDSEKKHQKFIDKYEFQYSLISDPEKEIINAFGVWGPKKFMGRTFDGVHRTTFIVDEDGKIESIISKVKTKIHGEQILNELTSESV